MDIGLGISYVLLHELLRQRVRIILCVHLQLVFEIYSALLAFVCE